VRRTVSAKCRISSHVLGQSRRRHSTSLRFLVIGLAMLAKVHSAAVLGIDAYPVEVEVNSGWGQPAVIIVGLPDAAVKESRDRVKTAIENSGFKHVMDRTTVNLALRMCI